MWPTPGRRLRRSQKLDADWLQLHRGLAQALILGMALSMAGFPTSVILAGGLGTRLREAVPNAPKSVAPVAGRPFLVHLLKQLQQAGARRIVLCTGYKSGQVDQEIGSHFEDAEIVYSIEEQPLGTGGALHLAWQRYGNSDASGWLVANGDSYCDLDLNELWRAHSSAGLAATLSAVEVPDGSRYGSLVWDQSNRLTRFGEKEDGSGARWINAGIYCLTPEFLNVLSAVTPLSLEREAFPGWLARGIHVFAQRARFIDIGTPDSYRAAQEFFGGSQT
jgi:D-glycero-alpha-D-manno-heptose 1-phosphate guanylyltransferase